MDYLSELKGQGMDDLENKLLENLYDANIYAEDSKLNKAYMMGGIQMMRQLLAFAVEKQLYKNKQDDWHVADFAGTHTALLVNIQPIVKQTREQRIADALRDIIDMKCLRGPLIESAKQALGDASGDQR